MSLKSTHSTKLQEKLFMTWAAHTFHWIDTEGFNGFLETREITEVSESEPVFKHNDNSLRPAFTTKKYGRVFNINTI